MARSGDAIDNPVTGERIVFHRTARDTGADDVRIETLRFYGEVRPAPAALVEPAAA
jgi:hypothetical protein